MSKHKVLGTAIAITLAVSFLFSLLNINISTTEENQLGEGGTRAEFPDILVTSDIMADTTWDVVVTDMGYQRNYVVRKNISVVAGVTLTIDPGVMVLFDKATYLTVAGTLKANGGLFDNGITFSPYREDLSVEPAPRDWVGIKFLDTSVSSVLECVKIEYADEAINCTSITSPTISNCTIKSSYFFAIYCGEYTSPIIKNCVIDTSRWSGIICDNRSSAVIEKNAINSCMHGIICYSPARINQNTIQTCWIGITCWGDANITNNVIGGLCTDGIDVFYSDPLIKNNYFDHCLGNGTRFIASNATVINNTYTSNAVGLDIPYEAMGVLQNMNGNTVNGYQVARLYYIGEKDMVIENRTMNSGWSFYSGYLTAQGSITLYDCENVTLKNCDIKNTMNSIFAANSTLEIYNSTFDNAGQAQLYLDRTSLVKSYNNSIDANQVLLGGLDCIFTSYGDIRVTVLDHDDVPIEGATVVVKEILREVHNATTNANGRTPRLVVPDKTVSGSGTVVISSPLDIQAFAEGYNFDENPRENIYVADTKSITFTDLGDIFQPSIIGVNIENGDRTVGINKNITIYFSEPMDQTVTETAFSISGDADGTFSWSGFNLTFTPSSPLEYQTYYTVTITADAADTSGNALTEPMAFSFTTVPKPESMNWVLIAAVAVIVLLSIGLASWWMVKKIK